MAKHAKSASASVSEVDKLTEEVLVHVQEIDSISMDRGMTKREAAEVYQAVAAECRDRARMLEDEADAAGEDD